MIVVYASGRVAASACWTARTLPSSSDQRAFRQASSSGGGTSRGVFGISAPVFDRGRFGLGGEQRVLGHRYPHGLNGHGSAGNLVAGGRLRSRWRGGPRRR